MLATVQWMLQKFTPRRRAPAQALLDTRQPVSVAARQQFKTFPSASPLFGSDPVIVRSPPGNYSGASLNTQNPDRGHQMPLTTKTGARG